MIEDDISNKVIGLAIKVHKALGPGLLESVYETALVYELIIDEGFRADIIINDLLIIELKSLRTWRPLRDKKLRIYEEQNGKNRIELDEQVLSSVWEHTTQHGAIIAVGYRLNSKRATQFRIWATAILNSRASAANPSARSYNLLD